MTNKITVREFRKLSLSSDKKTTEQGENYTCVLSQEDFDFLLDLETHKTDILKKIYENLKSLYGADVPVLVKPVTKDELQIQNFVGTIQLPSDNTVLEILPKVQITKNEYDEREKLIDMVFYSKPKISYDSVFKNKHNSLQEYVIYMFLRHMGQLLKRGIKQNYISVKENALFIKGKILFAQDIKYNSAMRHRTYIEYEDYTPDCLENRLLHSALWACVKHSKDPKNKRRVNRYCHMFDSIGIGKSTNLKDFNQWHDNPTYPEYQNIKQITEIILRGIQPFMSDGKNKAPAILFPMEIVYEKYIAHCLKQHAKNYDIKTQPRSKKLTDKNFNLQPDIFMKHKQTRKKTVLDTKWKRYDNNNEISQPDAYQMFAYSEAYNADTILLYPKNHALTEQQKTEIHIFECGYEKNSKNLKKLKTHITDLDKSPKEIAKNIINAIPESK